MVVFKGRVVVKNTWQEGVHTEEKKLLLRSRSTPTFGDFMGKVEQKRRLRRCTLGTPSVGEYSPTEETGLGSDDGG